MLDSQSLLIAGLLTYPSTLSEVAQLLTDADLTDQPRVALREIRTISALGGTPDLASICARQPDLAPDLARWLAEHSASIAGPSSVVSVARSIADARLRTAISDRAMDLMRLAQSGAGADALAKAAHAITETLSGQESDGPSRGLELDAELRARIKDRLEGKEDERIWTGIDDMDRAITIRPGQLIVMAGRPGMGKTAHALHLATCAARSLGLTLFCSFEMSRQELWSRVVAMEGGLPMAQLMEARPVDPQAAYQASHRAAQLELIVDDRVQTIEQVAAQVSALRAAGIKCVILDYLQLMVAGHGDREARVAAVSREAKLIARRHGVVVILLAQLNRQVEQRPDKRPFISDLRESGAIEQDADAVILLYRDCYYSQDRTDTSCELIIGKSRHGPTGVITLDYQAATGRIGPYRGLRRKNV